MLLVIRSLLVVSLKGVKSTAQWPQCTRVNPIVVLLIVSTAPPGTFSPSVSLGSLGSVIYTSMSVQYCIHKKSLGYTTLCIKCRSRLPGDKTVSPLKVKDDTVLYQKPPRSVLNRCAFVLLRLCAAGFCQRSWE